MNNPGFVYFLTNPSMPGVVKIGCSQRPYRRAEALGSTSGIPTPFKLEFFQYVLDMQFVEQTLHRMLARFRISPDREFFQIDLVNSVEVFSDWICKAGLLPKEREDYTREEDGILAIHSNPFPLTGKVNPRLTPLARFEVTRQLGAKAWSDYESSFSAAAEYLEGGVQ